MMDNNKFIYLIMTVMIGGVISVGVIGNKDNTNYNAQAIQNEDENVDNIVITRKTMYKKENNVTGNINIPVIKLEEQNNKSKDISKIFENKAMQFYDDVKNRNKEYSNYAVNIDYEVMRNNNNILSVYTMYNKYDDNSNEYHNDISYNIDLRTGRILELKDLFVENYNFEEVINNKIKTIIKENKEFNLYKSFEKINNNQIYYIKDNKLIIYFQPGEIGEYSIGSPRFEIPISLFGENFKDEYISN